MSLIVSQTPVNRLPAELVNNAAFVKQVDFDPVHQTTDSIAAGRIAKMVWVKYLVNK
ncbi:hypothetical protein AALA82_19235 [Oscillospiraceae bacterium 50-16]